MINYMCMLHELYSSVTVNQQTVTGKEDLQLRLFRHLDLTREVAIYKQLCCLTYSDTVMHIYIYIFKGRPVLILLL